MIVVVTATQGHGMSKEGITGVDIRTEVLAGRVVKAREQIVRNHAALKMTRMVKSGGKQN